MVNQSSVGQNYQQGVDKVGLGRGKEGKKALASSMCTMVSLCLNMHMSPALNDFASVRHCMYVASLMHMYSLSSKAFLGISRHCQLLVYVLPASALMREKRKEKSTPKGDHNKSL